ncbi:CPBP family intramembrane glutamic endopeptidase [uncultured Paenibacillus sp.]|uniref:CPBP family intramembrane glutamic endopeptidase n=1 Tax=uncultured Paenibacillus sp. TaxID=227322 RepID=UPI0035A72C33
MEVKNLFSYEDTIDVNKKDGIILILYYVYLITCTYLFGLIMFNMNILYATSKYINNISLLMIMLSVPMFVLQLLPIMLILLFRGQSLTTIGITKFKILRSIIIGLIAAVPLNALPIYGYLKGNYAIQLCLGNALLQLIYYIVIIGFAEEIIFRGYLQTRISALISNNYFAIFTGSFMFAILHIPFQMVRSEMSLYEYITHDWFDLLLKGLMHLIFVFIYSRTKNIIAPSIAHGLLDFFNN